MMNPGLLGLVINPFYFSRKALAKSIARLGSYITGKTLDIGCGKKPYQEYFDSTEYIGLEIDTPDNRQDKTADFYYDGSSFPFADSDFDSIVCNEVLEHVFEPDQFVQEINRVLKQGGYALLTVPFAWDEHEQPFDYARYSSFGLKFLLQKHGFEVVESTKTCADVRVVFQLANAYLYKVTLTRFSYINLLITIILIFPFNLIGSLLYIILPKNIDLYLDNVILVKKNEQ
jgi:SAM-dependent methyltransferase